jgi:hypothetical protein
MPPAQCAFPLDVPAGIPRLTGSTALAMAMLLACPRAAARRLAMKV